MTSMLPVPHSKDTAERKILVTVICTNKRVTVEIVSDCVNMSNELFLVQGHNNK